MPFDRSIPLVGFHTRISEHSAVSALIQLIEEGLAPMGFNTLILEFNPGFSYRCFPQYSNGTFTYEDAVQVREVCKKYGIRPVPLFQCLSHQSNFGAMPWPLLLDHPEFCETPDIPHDATWPDIYCHSWCASNDGIYDYVFPMIDELIEAFEATAVHIGLDEVFEIGEECCPRCAGKDKAALFARTVKILHDHLAQKDVDTMMWGDRLLDAKKLGYTMWDGDVFGMYPAFDRKDEITRDIIITDWHYDVCPQGYGSVSQFMQAGFFTVPSFGANVVQAKQFWAHCLEDIYLGRKNHWSGKLGGLLCTHWSQFTQASTDAILAAIRGETVTETDDWGGAKVGKVIAGVVPKGKNFRK